MGEQILDKHGIGQSSLDYRFRKRSFSQRILLDGFAFINGCLSVYLFVSGLWFVSVTGLARGKA
jgi:hypothetical protein